jgi:hypothetical protein
VSRCTLIYILKVSLCTFLECSTGAVITDVASLVPINCVTAGAQAPLSRGRDFDALLLLPQKCGPAPDRVYI